MRSVAVAVAGYYCTGTSAVIDLLKEYENVSIASPVDGDYEHMVFYAQGALFDLASILLSPYGSVYGSDMAVNEFIDAARRLNDNNFGWYGSYKKYYGSQYMEMVKEFVDAICRKKERMSAAHTRKIVYSPIKAILQIGARIIYKRPITSLGRKYVFDNKPSYIATPSFEEFQIASRRYVSKYVDMCSKNSEINVFDHLIWPQQYQAVIDLFPNNIKVIVVDRDPTDIYLLNKYYWHKPPISSAKPYYPTSPKAFCKEWRDTIINAVNDERFLFIHFEDLVYNYCETVKKIEEFLMIDEKHHIRKNTTFVPSRSIENTQVKLLSDEWQKEVEIIEDDLKEYLYDFPYKRIPDRTLWFDTNLQLASERR